MSTFRYQHFTGNASNLNPGEIGVDLNEGKLKINNGGNIVDFINSEDVKDLIDNEIEDKVKDGMLENVELKDDKLVFTFNEDAEIEPIEIDVTKIFQPDNYLTKDNIEGDYVSKDSLETKLSEYATEQWVEDKNYLTEHQDLSNYALKSELPTDYLTEENLEGYATEDWVNGQGFIKEHQDLSNLATAEALETAKTELTTEINKKADSDALNDYMTKAEAASDHTEIEGKIPNVTGFFDGASYNEETKKIEFKNGETVKVTIDATPFIKDGMIEAVEVKDGELVITFNTDAGSKNIEINIKDIFNADNYYDKDDADEKFVAWGEYQGRKVIQLANYDNISGLMTDGTGVNIAMVSKWDVADFGSTKLPINLNGSKDRPTYNDDKEIALLEDVPSLEGYASEEWVESNGYLTEHQSLAEYATLEDVEGMVKYTTFEGTRKTISLNNRDTISANTPKGGSQIAMVSDYDGLDFPVVELGGQNGALVLNTLEDRVKVEVVENGKRVQHSVATLDDIEALKAEFEAKIDDVRKIAEKALVSVVTNGGSMKLESDLNVNDGALNLNNDTVIDLNGNNLNTVGNQYGDAVVINGANVTIKNGEVKASDNTSLEEASAVIMVKGESNVTLDNVKADGVYPVYVNDPKATVVIKGDDGVYTSNYDKGVAVYVQKGGKVTIEGGTFGQPGHTSTYLLNLKDDLVKGGADPREFILVKGGKFYNFNPAASMSEPNGPVSFVATGYKVNETQEGEDKVYTVVKRDEAQAAAEVAAGGKLFLSEDVFKPTGDFNLIKDAVIDLNGNAIGAKAGGTYGDSIVIGNGANVTIKNGVIKESENATQENSSAVVLIKTTAATTVTLENVEVEGMRPLYLNNGNAETTVTIKSGIFTCTGGNGEAVYVQKGGKITIEGGYFSNPNATEYKGFLLNIKDDARQGKDPREFIEVKGGTFVNFDPSNNKAEGEGTNFVADGYHVEQAQDGKDTIYTVVKD